MKMMIGGKVVTSVVMFLITVFITYVSITKGGSGDLKFSFSLPKAKTNPPSPSPACPPLRVFMYDLPKRFNVGMLRLLNTTYNHNDSISSSPLNVENMPLWPHHPQLQQQHSVEYWMTISLLHHHANEEEEAVRVSNPEAADVFFVPFFSSLSFNTHGRNMTDPDTEFDRQLQVDMLTFLRESDYWQRTSGRDHVIPMHHPNAFRFLREQLNASILIVADFGRFPKTMSTLHKDVVAPYKHVVDSFMNDSSNPYQLRTTLLFFRGRTVRKAEGKVRRKLEKILQGYDDVHFEASYATGEGINASTQGMRSSKFCLHPAGDTPSSNRLFDAIVSHCVPVIISDHIELPFESELDYSKFSLFFSVKDALVPGYMVEHLRKIPESEWLKMWTRLKEIAHHFEYQFPPTKDDAVNMIWRQVRSKVPAERLAVNRNRRLMIPDWW